MHSNAGSNNNKHHGSIHSCFRWIKLDKKEEEQEETGRNKKRGSTSLSLWPRCSAPGFPPLFHPILCKLYVMSFTTAGEEQTAKALGKEKFAIDHLLPICRSFAELQLQVMQVIPCSVAAWLGKYSTACSNPKELA